MCGVLSKRNNPCTQPAATCRYHGPYANGGAAAAEYDDEDDAFVVDDEEDEELYDLGEEDALMDECFDEEFDEDEDSPDEDEDSLQRFQQHFLHKKMPNVIYFDPSYSYADLYADVCLLAGV